MKQNIRRFFIWRSKYKEGNGNPEIVRLAWVFFLICFVAGIIVVNSISSEELGSIGIWNSYFVEKFKYMDIRSDSLFFYILGERLPAVLLLLFLTITSWGFVAGLLFIGWQGFAVGFLTTAAIIKYGIKGLLLVGTALFPQYFVYIPIYLAYLYLAVFFKQHLSTMREQSSGKRVRTYIIFMGIGVLLMIGSIVGIFLESYANPFFLKNILDMFY
jgi:hypothetical protein